MNWFYKSGSKSATNSERDDSESIADSVDTNDTLEDTVIENLMLEKNIDMQFRDILDVDKSSLFWCIFYLFILMYCKFSNNSNN